MPAVMVGNRVKARSPCQLVRRGKGGGFVRRIHGCTRCRGEAERTVRCWWWIDCDGSCRPDAGCLSLLKWSESGWHRAATSAFREKDVALRLLTSGNRWRP